MQSLTLRPIQDLKVAIHGSSLVLPRRETEKRSMFLSNIDKVLGSIEVKTVHFFAAAEGFPFTAVTERIRAALSEALVPYDFLAGRLGLNPATGRLEIDCNAAGAGFVVGSTKYELDELGDLVCPNPGFSELVGTRLFDLLELSDRPLLLLQLTSFKCGGFAIAITRNHAALDGLSFKTFLDNLAALAADKPILIPPITDRRLLAARSPPRVTFRHPELVVGVPKTPMSTKDLDIKVFHLSSDNISYLKTKAIMQTASYRPASGFNVVAAHVWRCKALSANDDENDMDRESTVLYAVVVRRKLDPPLPAAYAGNAVVTAYATATCRELRERPLGEIAEKVREGACRITNEYVRSVIDWGEMHVGFPGGEFLLSSWRRLGFADVEYPWGRPRYICPVDHRRKNIILLFPDAGDGQGVNVMVALPKNDMDMFERMFHEFLAQK